MHGARARIVAAQRVVRACGGKQLAMGGLGAKTVGAQGHGRPERNAMLVLEDARFERYRLGASCHCDGVLRTEFVAVAVAQRRHAVHPIEHRRRGIKNVCQRRDAMAREPQRVVGRKICRTGLDTKQKVVLFHHVCNAPQVRAVGCRGLRRTHAVHAAAHGTAVGGKGLRRALGRIGKQHGGAARLQVVGHGRPEQRVVGPVGQDARHALERRRVQRRLRLQVLQHRGDQRSVAINVGADLQHRRAPVTAGQRQHVGLGQDAGHHHRLPGQLLEAQHEAHFFRKRRSGVMVQDERSLGHGSSEAQGQGSAGRHSMPMWAMPSSRYSAVTGTKPCSP